VEGLDSKLPRGREKGGKRRPEVFDNLLKEKRGKRGGGSRSMGYSTLWGKKKKRGRGNALFPSLEEKGWRNK